MKILYTCCFIMFFFSVSNAQVKYVTQDGAGLKDGTSWANAWSGIIFADTLYAVPSGTSVWVAKGTYIARKDETGNFATFPMDPTDSQDIHRQTTFMVPNGVQLRGGFAGTETTLNDRVDSLMFGENRTYLEGSYIPAYFNPSDCSGNILTLKDVSNATVVDGLCIGHCFYSSIFVSSTNNNKSEPVIKNCLFDLVYNFAYGPIWIFGNSTEIGTTTVYNCYFTGGDGAFGGGAILAQGNCKLNVANSVFTNCKGSMANAIALSSNYGAEINDCTFYDNSAGFYSGNAYAAIVTADVMGPVNINNSIFYNNKNYYGTISNLYSNFGSSFKLINCNFQQQDPSYSVAPFYTENCISNDPKFKNTLDLIGPDNTWFTADDGLSLSATSPCINAGFNDVIPDFVTTDILKKLRVEGCKVDMGAFEYKSNTENTTALPSNNYQVCTQYPVATNGNAYLDNTSCTAVTTVIPSGSNPISGIVKVCVTRLDDVPVIAGIPYVQRFYDIEPLVNPATSTSTITLYYTQTEFDNYNTVASGYAMLPTSPLDVAGKANIRIQQEHGFSATGEPGTFNGSAVSIDPDDSKIIWNATASRWEVTFDVTGFSGFFIYTSLGVLPVTLINFDAQENKGSIALKWSTATEINTAYFEIQRSNNGTDFTAIQKVAALNNATGSAYKYDDAQFSGSLIFYRLRIIDKNGHATYSSIIVVSLKNNTQQTTLQIAPNPAVTTANITITGKIQGKATIELLDMNGRMVGQIFKGNIVNDTFNTNFNVEHLAKGIYTIQCILNDKTIRGRLIVL